MNRLDFSHNWNNKLQCNVFSTIRRHLPAVHYHGKIVEVYDCSHNPARFIGRAEYILVSPIKLHQLKPAMALLDTGYGLNETKEILINMYKNKVDDVHQESFCYCILKKIKEKPVQHSMF